MFEVVKEKGDHFEAVSSADGVPAGGFRIIVFDVGEGSAQIVISPTNEAAVIDTGPKETWNSKILPHIKKNNISLKYLFITHGDSDHAGAVFESGKTPREVMAGNRFALSDGVFISVPVSDCEYEDKTKIDCPDDDDNARGSAYLVEYGGLKTLITGDLPGGGGDPPYDTIDLETHLGELVGNVDVLVVGHHGSNTSSNGGFLEEIKPESAIISVGDDNPYWHPHSSTIERLEGMKISIYQTERGWLKEKFLDSVEIFNGDITVQSDGSGYIIF